MTKLWQDLSNWFFIRRMNWQFQQEHTADSISAWWWCFKYWLKMRPMRVECASGCGSKMWHNGPARDNSFCSESCAYYGKDAFKTVAGDDIPF